MTGSGTTELSDWSFPNFETVGESPVVDAADVGIKNFQEPDIHDIENVENSDVNAGSDVMAKPKNKTKNKEQLTANLKNTIEDKPTINPDVQRVEQLKKEYENKISTLENILAKLKTPASIIDEELTDMIQDIVKKIAKRVILKEINLDSELFIKMIAELKASIDSKNGMVQVYISGTDFKRLEAGKSDMANLATIDNSLYEGDILVKSHYAEVRAILNERIDQLIKVQND